MVLGKVGRERLYLTVAACELVMGGLDNCNVSIPMSQYILWLFLICYGALAFSQKYSTREWLLLIGLLTAGVVLYAESGLNTGIKLPLFLCALRDIDKRKYCQMTAGVLIVLSVCVAVAARLFGFGNMYFLSSYERGIKGQRYCFGYSSPNRMMGIVLMAIIFGLAVYARRMKWHVYLLAATIWMVLFWLTDSRTSYYIGILLLIGCFIVTRQSEKSVLNNIAFGVFLASLAVMLGISILAACKIENDFMSLVNTFINGRINQLGEHIGGRQYALPFIENWHLFGTKVNHSGYDMGYIQLFYYYGIVFGVCSLAFWIYAAWTAWRNKDTVFLLLLTGLCSFLFMESMFFCNMAPMHFLLVFSGICVWKDKGSSVRI